LQEGQASGYVTALSLGFVLLETDELILNGLTKCDQSFSV